MKRLFLDVLWPRPTPEEREAWHNASTGSKVFVAVWMVALTAIIFWLME